MIRKLVLSILLLYSFQAFSQKGSYLDSLSQEISKLSKKEQVEQIVSIPYDKVVSNIRFLDSLTEKAIAYSKEIKDTLLLAKSLEKKRLVLHFTSRTEETIALSLEIIKLYETLNLPVKVGDSYANLAWKIKYLDLDKSMRYMTKAIALLESNFDAQIINPVYDNYGVLHALKHQLDSALYYHNKSLKLKKTLNDSVGIPFGYCHLAEIYAKQSEYNKAEAYLDSAMVIREKRKDIYGISDTHLYIGDLYFKKKDYNKAVNSYEKGFNLSKGNSYYPLKKYASEYLYKSYEAKNDYKNALHYHLVYTKLKDSVLNTETNNRIHELEIRFQTEKKEKEILSQRADLAEKELDLSKKNTYILGLGALAVVLGLLGYLFYNQQRLKNRQLQKENELKDALIKIETQNKLQEQRLRISRDLHDNIGAQLTFIISSIDNLKYGFKIPYKLGDKLKSISEFTTTTIHELRDTIWAMNKDEITFEDLEIRISNFIDKANLAAQNIKFNFKVENKVDKQITFSSIKGINIYRIIQEAINNSLKYANASVIEVLITEAKEQMKISISDDGNGFNEADVDLGNGLNNMKKRAEEIHGELTINSNTTDGTIIILEF
ncbi:tetratricopeptide repeat-containing sensor histidine kinase [Winogradskyella sp.]|jgi:signal transduction histidine kinase|uniref:tetratricopeptide repeat-containing sensor histidine kinase n=1 Tax=Winogradskyella sp. TaxID=1883156 RepID=UPI0025CC3203|nr:tetratricopeptide repeat-containing sensor histidine kinase [Winogradskyella sp.]MCT4629421.1 histidine kinase [Winogradskyella sp.]